MEYYILVIGILFNLLYIMSSQLRQSRGDVETSKLRSNIEDQLNRLLTQLSDLEEMRDDLENDEYEQTRKETMDQLQEFEVSLQKILEGNITLVSDIGSVQLRIQDAIRLSFKSADVTKLFVQKENGALRRKLASLDEDKRLGRISTEQYEEISYEIIIALDKLGEELSINEKALLEKRTNDMSRYKSANENISEHVFTSAQKQLI